MLVERESCVDGLGKLTRLTELGIVEKGIAQTTTYGYDALDNLTSVTQPGSAGRVFSYSSLGRLSSATNPESGTTSYLYDANGNVSSRADGRGLVTSYSYNELDQITNRQYSDYNASPPTPWVVYTYNKGWLTQVQAGANRLM